MFTKISTLILMVLLITQPCSGAWLLRMSTEEQREKLCVSVIISIDNRSHYFYYKHIATLDEDGLKVKFGKRLENINHIPFEQILNYEAALAKYVKLKEEQP